MSAFLKPRDCSELKQKSQTRNFVARVFRGVFVLWTVLATGQNPWVELKSLNFKVTTNAGEEAGRLALFELEQLHAVLPSSRDTSQFDLFYFADHADVARYAPERYAGVIFQAKGQDRAVAAAAGLRPLLHEYVHFALGNSDRPPWLNEGLAEYYSAVRLDDGRFVIGLADPWALALLRESRPATEEDRFYADSWARVHLLMSKGADLQAPISDAELTAHIAAGAPGGTRDYRLVPFHPARFQMRRLSDSEVALRLTALLPQGERMAALEKLTAADPSFTAAWEQLALCYFAASEFDAAQDAYRRVTASGSDDARSWYLAGLLARFHFRDDAAGERLLYRAAALDPANHDYRVAWDAARESREAGEEAALRARALEGQVIRTQPMRLAVLGHQAAPAIRRTVLGHPPGPAVRRAAPPVPVLAATQRKPGPVKTWIFAGARLLGCSGPPDRRVCTYSR